MTDKGPNKQILALWLGKHSQQFSFTFYNLQAQQIYNEEQDPIVQGSIWKNIAKLEPRMLVFDMQIDRLPIVRAVNNKKIIQNMKKEESRNALNGIFGQINTKYIQNHDTVTDSDKWPLHSNWKDKQSNYYLINNNHITLPKQQIQHYSVDVEMQKFHIFEEFYQINGQQVQNKLRKQLQDTDYLKVFSLCSDQSYSGFTYKMVEYLKQQCPKKSYILSSLTSHNFLPLYTIPQFYEQLDIIIPININNITAPYFNTQKPALSFAPYLNCILTPFTMKNVDPYYYTSIVAPDKRKLFNSAFILPAIDTTLTLNKITNIFIFQQSANTSNGENLQAEDKRKKKNEIKETGEEGDKNRINFTNDTYLSLAKSQKKGKFISESYILKGHFNNFQKQVRVKAEPSSLSIKYLQGIFSAPVQPQLHYDKFYYQYYQDIVQTYPYHVVMFNHEIFGDSIRQNLLKKQKKGKLFNDDWPQNKEKMLSIADSYLEHYENN